MAQREVSREIGMPKPDIKRACSDLLQSEVSYNGWLRKQSVMQKKVKLFKGIIPWSQKYVVLSRGCMYIYENETSKKPNSAFSLFGYNQIARAGEVATNEAPWAFKMMHIDQKKQHFFSAGSEREQKEWMLKIKDEMLYANNKPRLGMNHRSITSMDMEELEDYVYASNEQINLAGDDGDEYQETDDVRPASRLSTSSMRRDMPLPEIPKGGGISGGGHKHSYTDTLPESDSDTNSEDSYNSIDPHDVESRPPPPKPVPQHRDRPPPPLPSHGTTSRQNSGGSTSSLPSPTSPSGKVSDLASRLNANHLAGAGKPTLPMKPPVSGAPKPPPRPKQSNTGTGSGRTFWDEVSWSGTDKDEANRIITNIGHEGVYLIRGDKDKVLVVYSESMARKYKIEKTVDEQYWISKESQFPSVKALIDHYTANSLPKRSTHLDKPYTRFT